MIFVLADENQEVLGCFVCADQDELPSTGTGQTYQEVEEFVSYAAYMQSGQVVARPPSPGDFYDWNPVSKTWAPNLEAARTAKINEITAERERRNKLPILFSGYNFDADDEGQRNVQAWVTMINAGVQLPDGFVWRDASNVNHPADANFVKGLGEAITMRGTMLYQQSWALKAQVATLTTLYDIQSLSWPS